MVSIVISSFAIAISIITLWLTFFHNGRLKMTHPSVIYFGPDRDRRQLKVFLRSLFYSTSKRGQVIEHAYVKITRNNVTQIFDIWVYGDAELMRGSGLFIDEKGLVCNHHFLGSNQSQGFSFDHGEYYLEVNAKLVGKKIVQKLFHTRLNVSEDEATQINGRDFGLYFDWGAETHKYSKLLKPLSKK